MKLDPRTWFTTRETRQLRGAVRELSLGLEAAHQKLAKVEGQVGLREAQNGWTPLFPWFSQLVSPIAAYYDGVLPLVTPAPVMWDVTLGLGVFFNDAYLDIIRAYLRTWVAITPQANGVVERLTDYIVQTGYNYQVQARTEEKVGKRLLQDCQRVVDDFLTKNEWFATEQDWFKRLLIDGEAVPRLFPQDNGITELRTIEPWQVRTPGTMVATNPFSPSLLFGVKTEEGDREKILGYMVTMTGNISDIFEVPAAEMCLFKRNTPKQVKRGISKFFAPQTTFQQTIQLLSNTMQGEAVRQIIPWIQETTGAAAPVIEQISGGIPLNASGYTCGPNPTFSGPSIPTTDKNLQMKGPPVGNAANAVSMLGEGYRAISVHFGVPVWMVSGTSDNSFAQSLVENDPLVMTARREQKNLQEDHCQLLEKVIAIAEDQDILPMGTLEKVKIVSSAPPIVVRDKPRETERHQRLYSAGVESKRSWTKAEDLDYDEQQQQIEDEGGVQPIDAPNPTTLDQSGRPEATREREQRHVGTNGGGT